MGQPSYPVAQRVGLTNLWETTYSASKWTAGNYNKLKLLENFSQYCIQILGIGGTSPSKFQIDQRWNSLDFYRLRRRKKYKYKLVKVTKQAHFYRLWVLLYGDWLILCFYIILKKNIRRKWRIKQALNFLRGSLGYMIKNYYIN